jgi:hypothetical protein
MAEYNRKDFLKMLLLASGGIMLFSSCKELDRIFTIVIANKNDKFELEAANYIKKKISQISQISVEIRYKNEKQPPSKDVIFIENQPKQKKDSFNLNIIQSKIVINGSNRGVLYGAAEFIDVCYEVIKVDLSNSQIKKNISLPQNLNISQTPFFDYRFVYQALGFDKEYQIANKLSSFYIDPETGKMAFENAGSVVHNLLLLFGYDKYFKQYPEYYPLVNGKRISDGLSVNSQHRMPCLSNEGVYKIIKKELQNRINLYPDLNIWNFSQPDGISGSDDYCNCNLCKPKHDKGNGLSETFFPFVNRLAADFPDKVIRTLAYNITSQPHTVETRLSDGKILKAGSLMPNVEIFFTLTNNDKSKALPNALDQNSIFLKKNLELWSTKTDKIFIWEYVVNFNYYLFPFPTIHTIKDNFDYFKKLNVKSLFVQISSMEESSFSELNSYIYSRFMWDAGLNLESEILKFCREFYGPGYEDMNSYINLLLKYIKADKSTSWDPFSGIGSLVYHANPEQKLADVTLFSIKHLSEFNKLIDSALTKTSKGTKYYKRILKEKLSILFVEIESATKYANKNGAYNNTFSKYITDNNTITLDEKMKKFKDIAGTLNISVISEGLRPVDGYIEDVKATLNSKH